MQPVRQLILKLLQNWIALVERRRFWVVIGALVLSVWAVLYTVENLRMNTSTKEMLSAELAWRQLDMEYERHFPQFVDNILVIAEAPTPDQAIDAADLLYRRLLAEQELFSAVYYPNALSLFRNSALLFLDTGELQDLADNLAAIQPFLSRLTDDLSIRGLFAMLSEALDAIEDGEDIDLAPLVRQVNLALEARQSGSEYRVSWHRLMSGAAAAAPVYREFIVLQPVLDAEALLPAERAIERLRELRRELELENRLGARVRLTGSVVLDQEELMSVARGTQLALLLALCAVTAIMLLGLGSPRLVFATILTLLCGLSLTAAFATATVGELNLISIAFAVLYIGLGVDFAIHYCLRYRELLRDGMDNDAAIQHSSVNIGSSLFLCAATTAIGFFAFIPTDYDGVAELGWISGAGIFISLGVTLTLLPALLMLMPLRSAGVNAAAAPGRTVVDRLLALPLTHARTVRAGAFVLALVLLGLLGGIRFDHNTLNLQDPHNESVQAYQDLLSDPDTSPWIGIILAADRAKALALMQRFRGLDVVRETRWIEDFIPADQDDKLDIIGEMSLIVGMLPESVQTPAISDQERLEAMEGFARRLERSETAAASPELGRLLRNLRAARDRIALLEEPQRGPELDLLSANLLASLPGRLDTLRASLEADHIDFDDLPDALLRRWVSADGTYLIEIYPRENVNDNSAMRRFVRGMQSVDPRVIGSPVINLEASDAVVRAFAQAFICAFAVIAVVLLLLLHRRRDAVYILLPLLLAAVFTGGASVLLDIPVNFANIIALPLLLGIGVDSGIHILHRYRTALPEHNNLLRTSSARAVVVSALTTMGGIGNLTFSPHAGTASMGKILTIGIAMTLICMLIVLPSLLAARRAPERAG
jgi:hopanoid biosynthesis associated RND transporter like protein HpnN